MKNNVNIGPRRNINQNSMLSSAISCSRQRPHESHTDKCTISTVAWKARYSDNEDCHSMKLVHIYYENGEKINITADGISPLVRRAGALRSGKARVAMAYWKYARRINERAGRRYADHGRGADWGHRMKINSMVWRENTFEMIMTISLSATIASGIDAYASSWVGENFGRPSLFEAMLIACWWL